MCVCVCVCVCARACVRARARARAYMYVNVKQLIKTIKDLLEQPHFDLSFGPHTSNTDA